MADGGGTIERIVHGFGQVRGNLKPGQLAQVAGVFETMKGLPLPPAYLEGLRVELLQMLGLGRTFETTSVYLSFYGIGDDRAEYLKIGVARSVRARMAGIATGNPLSRLWTFEAAFAQKVDATTVEAALIQHMAGDKIHGEWVYVKGVSEQAASAIVESLAEVASEVFGSPVRFSPARM